MEGVQGATEEIGCIGTSNYSVASSSGIDGVDARSSGLHSGVWIYLSNSGIISPLYELTFLLFCQDLMRGISGGRNPGFVDFREDYSCYGVCPYRVSPANASWIFGSGLLRPGDFQPSVCEGFCFLFVWTTCPSSVRTLLSASLILEVGPSLVLLCYRA